MSAPGVTTSDLQKKDVQAFTAATAPRAAEYGPFPALIDGVTYLSDGASDDTFPKGWANTDSTSSPIGNTLCVLGDSFDERSEPALVSTVWGTEAYGQWGLTNMLLGQKFNCLAIDGSGGSGATLPGGSAIYADRLQPLLDMRPTWMRIRASVNDTAGGATFAQMRDAYGALFDRCKKAGAKIITNTISPNITANQTATEREDNLRLNEWLAYYVPNNWDAVVLPHHWQMLDPDSLNNQVVGNADVHPTLPQAFKMAQTDAAILSPMLAHVRTPIEYLSASGSSSNNSADPNPINIGTGGSIAAIGAGGSGSVATSYNVGLTNGNTTSTCVASKVARTDGPGYWQQLVWTPSVIGQALSFNPSSTIALNAGLAVGDLVQFMFEFEWDNATAAADAHYPWAYMLFTGGSLTAEGFKLNSGHAAIGATGWRGVAATPPVQIPVGTTSITIACRFLSKTLGAKTIRIGQHGIINLTRAGVTTKAI